MEKGGDEQLDHSCQKLRSIMHSQVGEK